MNEMLRGITWGATENLLYAPLFIFVVLLVWYRVYRLHSAAKLLVTPVRLHDLLPYYSVLRNCIKSCLMTGGVCFLLFALMRPCWNMKDEVVEQEGRDLFIALDISRSMLARDCDPYRLAFAKEKIKKLVHMLSCERVGLILFSGSTFVQCPLTSDHAAFFMFLDQIDVETISSGTTAIDQAIKQALRSFSEMPDRKNKLLVLFTDGEDFSSNLAGIKRDATAAGLHIFTLGVGTPEGAPIPLFDDHGKQTGHQVDKKGNVVISRLNEGILHALASDSGGTYIRLIRESGTDLQVLVNKVYAYEKEKIEEKKISTLEEQYPYFLIVSFLCFLFEWLL